MVFVQHTIVFTRKRVHSIHYKIHSWCKHQHSSLYLKKFKPSYKQFIHLVKVCRLKVSIDVISNHFTFFSKDIHLLSKNSIQSNLSSPTLFKISSTILAINQNFHFPLALKGKITKFGLWSMNINTITSISIRIPINL